jgi:hypothetical protein
MKAVAYEPRRSDVPLVIQAANTKVPPHTDYLTMGAIDALAQKALIGEDHRVEINSAINVIADRLGPNHKQRVEGVRARSDRRKRIFTRIPAPLMCPACGSRSVTIVFELPTNRQVGSG